MESATEEWKAVKGHCDYYQVSNLGRVRVKDRWIEKPNNFPNQKGVVRQMYKGRVLKCCRNPEGYIMVTFGYNKKYRTYLVHRLVAEAFIGKPENPKLLCCHRDGDPSNNKPENLYWGSQKDNMSDRKAHGNYKTGVEHHFSKFSEDFIEKVRGMSAKEAINSGVSRTHYYRIKNGER